jgi:hypothetical protein
MAKISIDLGKHLGELSVSAESLSKSLYEIFEIVGDDIFGQIQVISIRPRPDDNYNLVVKIVLEDPTSFGVLGGKFDKEFLVFPGDSRLAFKREILNNLVIMIGCRQQSLSDQESHWRKALGNLLKHPEFKRIINP